MAIAYGAGTTGGANSNTVTFTGPTVTGENTLGILSFAYGNDRSISTVTWGGVAMTQVQVTSPNNPALATYHVVNPSSAASIVITVSGNTSTSIVACADYYTGVTQSGPLGASDKTTTDALTKSITTTVDNSLFYAAYSGFAEYADGNQAAGDGLTERGFYAGSSWSVGMHIETGDKSTTTAGSYTGSWGNNGGINHNVIVAEFTPTVDFMSQMIMI